MKMKRMDFKYGVITLTACLLLPIFLHIYGYLDQLTFVSDIHKNSFYENSTEVSLEYLHYKLVLYAIYVILVFVCYSLILSSFVNRIERYQIQCYRLCLCYSNCFKIHQHDGHRIWWHYGCNGLGMFVPGNVFSFSVYLIIFSVYCTKIQVLGVSFVCANNSDSFFNDRIPFLYFWYLLCRVVECY